MSAAYELSPQQRQIFALRREHEVAGLAILFEGKVELSRLRDVVRALETRHEILRTTLQRRAGMKFPFQVISEPGKLDWEEVDLSALSETQKQARIEALLRGPGIDIEKGPVFRASCLKLEADSHLLVITSSALCVDRASLNNIYSEIARLSAMAPEEVLQYADYSQWQNESVQNNDATRHWEQLQLESVPSLRVPLQRKSGIERASWETVPVAVDDDIRQLLAAHNAESFLFACWQAFLARISGQQEFAVGYVSDGRNHVEFRDAIGVFSKTLPVRVSLDEQLIFADLVPVSEAGLAQAREWQDYFVSDLTAEQLSVGLAFEILPEKVAAGELVISEFARTLPASDFRLQLRSTRAGGSTSLAFDFDSSRIASEYAQELSQAFSLLCRAAAKRPALALGALPITTESERRKVVVEFNQTAADYPKDECVHQLFEEQVARYPNRPALRFGGRELSFLRLNQEANRIAHILQQKGVRANVPVGLCLERSAEMILGLLGVLKAGGCYVPLVPDHPPARLGYQLSETGAPVVLTEEKHLQALSEFKGNVICLDRDGILIAAAPDSNPQVDVSPEDLVYVIYTSGSTGMPKGVALRHSNLVNYSHFICQRLELDKFPGGLHFATVSTISADLGNTCIFPALISGGCLHVIEYETAMSATLLGHYTARYPIDVLKITPSHLSTLLGSENGGSILPRKYLLLGGESLSWDLIKRVRAAGSCTIFNHYGPTEATVGCCTFRLDSDAVGTEETATVPIGRPIANDQVYIVDSLFEPLPVGISGELCVGGAGIAQGYLNQPQQTAERFVRNPFGGDSAARLYRTGDLARFLPDGNIEFLGRIDQQVKIRGFRVEPAEVETVLKRHPSVKQAAVVPFEDTSDEKRLAAYVVGRGRAEELRAFLANELPDYMLPTTTIFLESLPLTANGKLDVRALPSPKPQIPVRELVAPRTPDEEKLAQIWGDVLKLDRVSVNDDFFALGGHSLLATQIISRIRNSFRVQMPLQVFLQSPTIASLAAQIGQCPAIESEQEEMARLLQELEGMSEEEAERLLAMELEKDKGGQI